MTKIDIVFFLIGVFCYFSIMMRLKEQDSRSAQYTLMQEKKQKYAHRIIEQKKKETMAKAVEERKRRRKIDFEHLAGTVEMLSNLSDQEVMRKSRITSGKF